MSDHPPSSFRYCGLHRWVVSTEGGKQTLFKERHTYCLYLTKDMTIVCVQRKTRRPVVFKERHEECFVLTERNQHHSKDTKLVVFKERNGNWLCSRKSRWLHVQRKNWRLAEFKKRHEICLCYKKTPKSFVVKESHGGCLYSRKSAHKDCWWSKNDKRELFVFRLRHEHYYLCSKKGIKIVVV